MSTTTSTAQETTSPTNQPVDKFRHGNLHASIFRNVNATGKVWYSTSVQGTYEDANGKWKTTSSFGQDELPVVAVLCTNAFNRIDELKAEDRKAAKTKQ